LDLAETSLLHNASISFLGRAAVFLRLQSLICGNVGLTVSYARA
jgi:hypothetical protein